MDAGSAHFARGSYTLSYPQLKNVRLAWTHSTPLKFLLKEGRWRRLKERRGEGGQGGHGAEGDEEGEGEGSEGDKKLSGQDIIFDILVPFAFQKYSIC